MPRTRRAGDPDLDPAGLLDDEEPVRAVAGVGDEHRRRSARRRADRARCRPSSARRARRATGEVAPAGGDRRQRRRGAGASSAAISSAAPSAGREAMTGRVARGGCAVVHGSPCSTTICRVVHKDDGDRLVAQRSVELILFRQLATSLAVPVFLVDERGRPRVPQRGGRGPARRPLRRHRRAAVRGVDDRLPARTPTTAACCRRRRLPLVMAAPRAPAVPIGRSIITGARRRRSHDRGDGLPARGRSRAAHRRAWRCSGSRTSREGHVLGHARLDREPPAPATQGYGGNTACVQVAGRRRHVPHPRCGHRDPGARRGAPARTSARVDILLSHLHMDHIQGLGFFGPFFTPGSEVHVWGPPSATLDLRAGCRATCRRRSSRCGCATSSRTLELHNAPDEPTRIGAFEVTAATIIHPGPTVGYRITRERRRRWRTCRITSRRSASTRFPGRAGVDVRARPGRRRRRARPRRAVLGRRAAGAGRLGPLARRSRRRASPDQAGAKRLVCFHHDPSHDDEAIDRLVEAASAAAGDVLVSGAREGVSLQALVAASRGGPRGRCSRPARRSLRARCPPAGRTLARPELDRRPRPRRRGR